MPGMPRSPEPKQAEIGPRGTFVSQVELYLATRDKLAVHYNDHGLFSSLPWVSSLISNCPVPFRRGFSFVAPSRDPTGNRAALASQQAGPTPTNCEPGLCLRKRTPPCVLPNAKRGSRASA